MSIATRLAKIDRFSRTPSLEPAPANSKPKAPDAAGH